LSLANPANLGHLDVALADLEAEPIAVPPLDAESLAKGHATHSFRGPFSFPQWSQSEGAFGIETS
jgi:hypothetical protein